MSVNLENGLHLTRSSPALSEFLYNTSVTESSMLCIVESDGSHSVSCHTLLQTWQPYLPDNCLKFGGASELSMDSDVVLPPVRTLADNLFRRGSKGSQQTFSVSKTAQDLINDYLDQETNPNRPVTVYPKRKTKVNQESQSDIDVIPDSYWSSVHTLDQSVDSAPSSNISDTEADDSVTIFPTEHFRAEACTSQNEASKNRGAVKAKVATRSAKSIPRRTQSRNNIRRCHAHTWASNSKSQAFLDQSDSAVCSSLDVTAAVKSLGAALAAKLQALLYSGTSSRKCGCECGCQSGVIQTGSRDLVVQESGTKCLGTQCRNKLMNDNQNDNNNCPGALCYKSMSQKFSLGQDMTTVQSKNVSNADDHPLCKPPCIGLLCGERSICNEQPNIKTADENTSNAQEHTLCKPPCRGLTCGERSKCNEQLNNNTPTEVNTYVVPSPAEIQTPALVPPLLKGYCTDSETCRVKTPESQTQTASSTTIVLKGPCLGPGKCINESLDPQTKCPGGCQAGMSPRISDNNQSELHSLSIKEPSNPSSNSKTETNTSKDYSESNPGVEVEQCKPKTPPLTSCPGGCNKDREPDSPKPAAPSLIWKDSCPGLEKYEHKAPPLTNSPSGCKVKDAEPDSTKIAPQSLIRKGSWPVIEKFKRKAASLPSCLSCKVKEREPESSKSAPQSRTGKGLFPWFDKCKALPLTRSPGGCKAKNSVPDLPKPAAQSLIRKDSYPECEKCYHEVPSLTICPGGCKAKNSVPDLPKPAAQSLIRKDSYPECEKCYHEVPSLTICPGGCKAKNSVPDLPKPAAQTLIWKDSYLGCEKCIHKAPSLTTCPGGCKAKNFVPDLPKPAAQTLVWKDSYLGCEKCINKAPSLITCPGGCKAKNFVPDLPKPAAQTLVWKDSYPGCEKCKHQTPLPTSCSCGCRDKNSEPELPKPAAQSLIWKDSCSGLKKDKHKTSLLIKYPVGCKAKNSVPDLPKPAAQSLNWKDSYPGFEKFKRKDPPLTGWPDGCKDKDSESPEPPAQWRRYRCGGYEIPTPLQFKTPKKKETSRAMPEPQTKYRNVYSRRPCSSTLSPNIGKLCPGVRKCQNTPDIPNDIPDKYRIADGGRRESLTFKTFEQQCPSISPSAVSLSSRRPPSQVPPSGRLKGLKGEIRTRNVGTGSCLPSPGLSISSTGSWGSANSRQKQNISKNVGPDRPFSDTKKSQTCGPCSCFSGPAELTQDTNTAPENASATKACGDDYISKEGPVKCIIPGIKSGQVSRLNNTAHLESKTNATKSVNTGKCCACVTRAKSLEQRHAHTEPSKSSTATGPGPCCGDLGLTIIQKRGTDPGPQLGSGERTKTGLLRPCCAHEGLRKSKEKKCSCTGKSSDNVSNRPAIKISRSFTHKNRTTIRKNTLRSCCSCIREAQGKAKISSRNIGVGSNHCLGRPTRCAATNTSQCVIVSDPVNPTYCKTVETQINTPQSIIVSDPVKPKWCKPVETQISESNMTYKKAPYKQTLNKCKTFCSTYLRCFGRRSQTYRRKILPKKESNCGKPHCPSDENPATSDTCPYGRIPRVHSQDIRSQQVVLDLQEPPTQPNIDTQMPDSAQAIRNQEEIFDPQGPPTELTYEKQSSELDSDTESRSQAQSIDTQMFDSAQENSNQEVVLNPQEAPAPSCCEKPGSSKLGRDTQHRNQAQGIDNQISTESAQIRPKIIGNTKNQIPCNSTSMQCFINPYLPFTSSQTNKRSQTIRSQTTSIESCKNPLCPFKASQMSGNPRSVENCDNFEVRFEDSHSSGNQITSIYSCESTNYPFRDLQTDRDQTTSVESCENPDCPFKDLKMDENETTSVESCDNPCCPCPRESEPNRKTSSRRRWASPYPNSFRNSETNTQLSQTNCRSPFEDVQTNDHPPCTNSYPSADSPAYHSNNERRDDEEYSDGKCRVQETQTRSVETNKHAHPYSSNISSRKGLSLKYQPVAQRTLKYFARPEKELPSRTLKVKDCPSNPQEVGECPASPHELKDYSSNLQKVGECPANPQEVKDYPSNLVSQQCDPSIPQGYSGCAKDGASCLQWTQVYLTTSGCDPECPQDYSGYDQSGASSLQGIQGYPTTPRCEPDCPRRCQRSVGPTYTECDSNRPALLSRSFAQTDFPYDENKPENRAKQEKKSGNRTKPTDYPCAQVCHDDVAPSDSALSLDSSDFDSSSKSEISTKYVKPIRGNSQKAPKSKKQSRHLEIPCVEISQQKITPCGSTDDDGSKKTSVKQPEVKQPKTPIASKSLKKLNKATSADFPCGICQQKLILSDSSPSLTISVKSSTGNSTKPTIVKSPKPAKVSKPDNSVQSSCPVCLKKLRAYDSLTSLAISATSAKSPKPPKVKSPKLANVSKPAKSVEFPCGICEQKLMSSDSSAPSSSVVSATSVKSSTVKPPKPATVSNPPKSVEFPCGICGQKLISSESSTNSAISAASMKSPKEKPPKPTKIKSIKPEKPQQASAEFPCGICQQKLTPAGSPAISQSVTPTRSNLKTKSKVASAQPLPSDFPCGQVCQQKFLPPMNSPGESPKPIGRTVVKLKDPDSYKGDQEGVISVAQYEKNKRKKKKTKQMSTDVCLPICGQDVKNKKRRIQVVDCVKGSKSVKASTIICQCPKQEPPKQRCPLACALNKICTCLKPAPPTPRVTVTKGSKERVVPCVFRTPGSSKSLKKPLPCQCPPPEPASTKANIESPGPTDAVPGTAGSEPSSCNQGPEICEAPANRGLKLQVHRKGPTELVAWCPLFNKC